MNIVILVSAIAEWTALKLMFPNVKIENFPYGECFNASVGDQQLRFFQSGWGKIASARAIQYVIDIYSPELIGCTTKAGVFDLWLIGRNIIPKS